MKIDITDCVLADAQQLAIVKLCERLAGGDVLNTRRDDVFELSRDDEDAPTMLKATTGAGGEVDVKARTMRGMVISTDQIDRVGDIVRQEGLSLADYQRNPVTLWAHNHRELPTGRTTRLARETAPAPATMRTVADKVFASDDANPKAGQIMRLYAEGVLNASSIGFRPRKFKVMYDDKERFQGVDFVESDLLEWSEVPVPANAGAVLAMRSLSYGAKLLDEMYRDVESFVASHVVKSIAPDRVIARDHKRDVIRESDDADRLSAAFSDLASSVSYESSLSSLRTLQRALSREARLAKR